jgi:hypothetical protein
VVFVTPVLIDAAGNRMHAPGEIPEKFPPQIAE